MLSISLIRWWVSYMGDVGVAFEFITLIMIGWVYFKLNRKIDSTSSLKANKKEVEESIKKKVEERMEIFSCQINMLDKRIDDKYHFLIDLMNKGVK